MKKTFLILVSIGTLLCAEVTIKSESFQEKKINGKTTWIKATKVIPGAKVRYINTISNETSEVASNLMATNVISEFMSYVDGSAECKTPGEVLFSVDNGKTFDVPKNLFVVENGKKRVAKPSEYSAIRWSVKALDAGATEECGYEAILK